MDKNTLCRLCLSTSQIYTCISYDETGNLIEEFDNLFKLFGLNISANPSKSSLICTKCVSKLEEFQKFHEKCVENEKLWDKFIKDDDFSSQNENEEEYLEEYVEDPMYNLSEFSQKIVKIKIEEPRTAPKMNPKKGATENVQKLSEEDQKIREFYDLRCKRCAGGVISDTFNEYKTHLRTVHNESHPGLICCNKKLSKRMDVIDHMNFHLDPDKLRCEFCKRVYSDTKNLKAHILQMHGNDEEKPFVCEPCGKRFARLDPLRIHMRCHLNEETLKNMRNFVCHECGGVFLTNAVLKAHIKYKHLRQGYVCVTCARHYKSKFDYELHRRNVHGESGPTREQCHVCEKWYSNSKALKAHIKAVHNRTEDMTCKICGIKTPSKQSLYGHMRMKHTERAHHCDVCTKSFPTPSRLKEHQAMHTGVALYTCPYCPNKRFNVRANMYKHFKVMHASEWERDKLEKNRNPNLFKSN